MKKIMLLGPPGAGKGTQSQFIAEHFNLPVIATGDMLRAAVKSGSSLGLKAKAIMDQGKLVSDDLIIDLVKARLAEPDCQEGFLFDGFPRTLGQAQALADACVQLTHVIDIAVADQVIIDRMDGRRVHPSSGRVYHEVFNPPKTPGVDNVTGEPLVQRPDDVPETVKKRLVEYHTKTAPLLRYYKDAAEADAGLTFASVVGDEPVAEVRTNLLAVLGA